MKYHRILIVGAGLAGVIERRRPFALLRASGLRLRELRQVVLLETAAAMLVTAAVGVGLGMASSYALALFADLVWTWPDGGVFAMVGTGVLAALISRRWPSRCWRPSPAMTPSGTGSARPGRPATHPPAPGASPRPS